MNFIRQNMFLVILVGVVVVVGGGMLFVLSSVAGEREQAEARRVSTAQEVSNQASKPQKVNAEIIKAKTDVALYAHQVDQAVDDQHIAFNARRYRVLQLPLYDTVTGKLLLSTTDIAWPALMKALRGDPSAAGGLNGPKRMAANIWKAIPKDVQSSLPPAGQPLNEDQQRALLGALNVIVQQADFYQPADYDLQGLQFPEALDRILRQRAKAERARLDNPASPEARFDPLQAQRINRMVLTAFFPDIFAPCQIPAFPINEEKYRQHALKFHFVQQYQQAMVALLDKLDPTRPPNVQEIQAEILLWDKQIYKIDQYKRRLRAKQEAEARGRVRPTTPMTPDGRTIPGGGLEEPGLEGPGMFGGIYGGRDLDRFVQRGAAGGGAAAEAKLDAKALGAMTAKMRRAEDGLVYAQPASLGLLFPLDETTSTSPSPSALWQAQVGYWITRDLIEAIRLTNEEGLAGVAGKKRNVLLAPIKQIVGIQVDAFGSGNKDANPARPIDPSMLGVVPGGRPSGGRAPVLPTPTAESLTTRASTRDYDIVKYTMTVVMGPQHLRRLQEHLLTLNYHVVLGVSMAEVPVEYDRDYYFGPQRGMLVTIEGELPLLTPWTRGKLDTQTNKWLTWNRAPRPLDSSVPRRTWVEGLPLMPADVLKSKISPVALRPEDGTRVRQAAAAMGLTPAPFPNR